MPKLRSLDRCGAAEFYALLGELAKALEWLDRAVRMGDDREEWFRRDSLLANIRDDPHFQQILASVAYRRAQRPGARGGNHPEKATTP
jgi:hypothetical protein